MSTVNLYYKITATLSSGNELKVGNLSSPVSITAASNLGSDTTYSVPTATVFTLSDDIDASTNFVVIISPVNATLEWNSSTDANNSSCGLLANVPFFLHNIYTTEYSSNPSTRSSNDLDEQILEIRIYHTAGSDQRVRVVTFD